MDSSWEILNTFLICAEACRVDKDCLAKINCAKPKPNPKKPTSKNPAKVGKVCAKSEKPCQSPNDCKLRYCQGKICKRPTHKPTCLSDADCNLAPKCIPKPKAKAKKGKKPPKVCHGNEGTECTNDVHCKVEGCEGKKCKVSGVWSNHIYLPTTFNLNIDTFDISILYSSIWFLYRKSRRRKRKSDPKANYKYYFVNYRSKPKLAQIQAQHYLYEVHLNASIRKSRKP